MCHYIPVTIRIKTSELTTVIALPIATKCGEAKQREVIALENLTEMLKGVLEGCVRELISRGETYGYEITKRLNALGFTDVADGTTYTILVRLEKNKLVNIDKRPSDMGPPRKFFTLNDAGRDELRRFRERWNFVASKIEELKGENPNV
jgi:DNA-binding PadR family transcriptional regulator